MTLYARAIRSLITGAFSVFLCLGLGGCSALFYKHKLSTKPITTSGLGTVVHLSNVTPSRSVQTAIDLSGNGLAVWEQWDGNVYNIFANRYNSGSGWAGPVALQLLPTQSSIHPQVAMDWSGNGMAVWQQWNGTEFDIYVAKYNPTTHSWGTATLIESTNESGENPAIAMNPTGDAIVVWQLFDRGTTRFSIRANRYTASSGLWSGAVRLDANTQASTYPAVSIDGTGNGTAVWQQYNGTRYHIVASRYTAGGTWSAPAQVDASPVGDAIDVKVAADASSNAVAVWQEWDGTRYHIISNRYVSGTGWGTVSAALDTSTVGSATVASVAFDANGPAFAIWQQADTTYSAIYASRSANGGATWGTPERVSVASAPDSINPHLGVNGGGEATAVWEQYGTGFRDVYASKYVPGTGWPASPTVVQSQYLNLSYSAIPRLAVNPAGNVILGWTVVDVAALDQAIDGISFHW